MKTLVFRNSENVIMFKGIDNAVDFLLDAGEKFLGWEAGIADVSSVIECKGTQIVHIWLHTYVGYDEYRLCLDGNGIQVYVWKSGRGWQAVPGKGICSELVVKMVGIVDML